MEASRRRRPLSHHPVHLPGPCRVAGVLDRFNNYTRSEPDPAEVDYNLYYSSLSSSTANFLWSGTNYVGFSSYQSVTGKDSHSQYADPQFLSLTAPNLQFSRLRRQ